MAVRQSVARPVRTGAQFTTAEVIVLVIDAFFADLSTEQHVALLGALTLLVGYVQVVLEDRAGKALLRQVPGPKVDVVEG